MNIVSNFLTLWEVIDPIYYQLTRLQYVTNDKGQRKMMRVRFTKYKGKELILSDGTVIHKNDLLIKIHLHNVKLLKKLRTYDNDIRRALYTFKIVQDSLPYIADYLQAQRNCNQIKGLIGITTISKGSEKLGFEVFTLKSRCYKWFKQLALLPIYYLSVKEKNREMPEPVYLVMTKECLIKKYPKIN